MTATVKAAMSPTELDTLEEWLKVTGMYTAGTTWFMEAQHIVIIEDMLLFIPPLFEVMHPVDEVYYLLMKIRTEIVGLEGLLPVVNLHGVLGFDRDKQ